MEEILVQLRKVTRTPLFLAGCITTIFSIRFLYLLPFSSTVKQGNYETITSKISFFIFAQEDFSFPLGVIKGLAFPFEESNIATVGAIPLFALIFKFLSKFIPYFQTFDYSTLLELLACLITACSVIYLVRLLGVRNLVVQLASAVFTALSFLIFLRYNQPFCVVAVPLYTSYFLFAVTILGKNSSLLVHNLRFSVLFPIAILLDSYTFIALVLGTTFLIILECFESLIGEQKTSVVRMTRLVGNTTIGILLSFGALYLIGMYPLPDFHQQFTSYDFGQGGRYHVADMFSPLIPVADLSFLSKIPFAFTTDQLQPGQYEGVAYIGSVPIFFLIILSSTAIYQRLRGKNQWYRVAAKQANKHRLMLLSPWAKVGLEPSKTFQDGV